MRTLALFLALATTAVAQPALTFEAPRHEVGTVTEGEVATHVFAFTNTGDAPLAIADVETTCGCTAPQWTAEPVPPGASGTVTVAFDTGGRPGPFERTVRVVSPEAGPVTLRLVGMVDAAFVAGGVPMGALTFSEAEAEIGDRHAFFFQHTGTRPVHILRVEAPDGLRATFPARRFYAGDVRAVIVTREGEEDSGETAEIRVVTDDEAVPVKTLRLTVR